MKNKILKLLFLCCFMLGSTIYASTLTITGANSSTPNSSVTININGDFTGRVNLTASNGTLSQDKVWIENNSQTVTVTLGASGTTTITASAENVSDQSGNLIKTISASPKSIAIKEKEVVNNTNNNTANNTGNNAANNAAATNTQKNTTTNNNASTKSSNNYLKSLQVSEEGLSPNFNKNKTSYSLSVSEKVTSLDVTALAEDSKAKVYVSGNTDLKDGDNTVYITVTAQNGAKRTYTILVNKSADPEKANSYLANLIIKDMMLSPEFSNEVLEYDGGTMKMSGDKLEIYAYPASDNAKVEIIGNENLVDGENTVTIKVTSEDGTSTKEYVIKFVKEHVEEIQALQSENELEDNTTNWFKDIFSSLWAKIKQNALLLLMYLFVIVEFVQIVYLYNKVKKKDQEIARLKSLNLDNAESETKNDLSLEDKKEEDLTLLSESFSLPQIEEKIPDLNEVNEENIETVEKIEDTNNIELNFPEEKEVIDDEDDTQTQIDNMVKSIWDEDDRLRFSDTSYEEPTTRKRNGKI